MNIAGRACGKNTYQVTARRAHWLPQLLRIAARLPFLPSIAADALCNGAQRLVDAGYRGGVKWQTPAHNIIPNVGLDHLLDVALANGTQNAAWYLGVTDGTPTVAAADTMASHAGWSEVTAYSEGARQTWTPGAVSGQSVDNSGAVATITCDTNGTTVGGAFLVSDNTKGGSTGVLYSVAAFQLGDKSLDDGETLDITGVFTQASA